MTVIYALYAVALPLLAAVLNLFLRGSANKVSGWVSTVAIAGSVIFSALVFNNVWNNHQVHLQKTWFAVGNNRIYAGMLLNNLSAMLLLLVSVIALPVHIYSIVYMKDDAKFKRYFIYLGFFCFSMLALVAADNMLLFYLFWELVGFSSYLLIGFQYTREKAVQANKKAFIMNRIGDVGLLIAILVIFAQYRTLDFDQLFGADGLVTTSTIKYGMWIGPFKGINVVWQYVAFTGVFLAVAAKSAQFPLHTWLPDAMEGPTSVSALIHAATMVAAGVFLLGRVYPLFTPAELNILAAVGCFTAFMAATIALTQNDLKRILAYSTISQLGYMVMAMGIGAYGSSLFHLATHAFFKCLLFLMAGVVIHQMQHIKEDNKLDIDAQNIQNMGGLRKKLPFTFVMALLSAASLIGLPLTSGYLSKDSILIQAFDWADGKDWLHQLVPYTAILTTWLTAFYVVRMIVKVFYGEFKVQKHHQHINFHISDGGWLYKLPMLLLVIACLFAVFSLNPVIYEQAWLLTGLPPIAHIDRVNNLHTIIPVLTNILSVFVIYAVYTIYLKRKVHAFPQSGFLYNLSYNQWYVDRFHNAVIVKLVLAVSRLLNWIERNIIDGFVNLLPKIVLLVSKLSAWVDNNIVDGFIHLLTRWAQAISNFVRKFQGGKVQYYLYSMLAVLLALIIYLGIKSGV